MSFQRYSLVAWTLLLASGVIVACAEGSGDTGTTEAPQTKATSSAEPPSTPLPGSSGGKSSSSSSSSSGGSSSSSSGGSSSSSGGSSSSSSSSSSRSSSSSGGGVGPACVDSAANYLKAVAALGGASPKFCPCSASECCYGGTGPSDGLVCIVP